MDAELVEEIRSKVHPALQDLIAMAAERNLSALSIESDGIALAVRRNLSPMEPLVEAETQAPPPLEEELTEARMVAVRSELVGIFRRTSGQSAVTAGERVQESQVLAYVESMRLMHEVKAPQAGRLAEILVEEGHPVEYGQPLMVLEFI